MVFKSESKTAKFKIENLPEAGSHVFFSDLLGSTNDNAQNAITGSWFRIERGPEATPPTYEYDEVGIVIEGTVTLRDETGKQESLKAGDTFVVHRGSTISFSTTDYGICWKCSGRLMAKL